MQQQRPSQKVLKELEAISKAVNKQRQRHLSEQLPFRGRLIMSVCNMLFRVLKPVNLEIMYIQVPPGADKDEFMQDFMNRVKTPLELRQPEPPSCCENHILEYMKTNNCCPIHDDDMQFYYTLCIKEEMYEQVAIIKKEAERRNVKLSA